MGLVMFALIEATQENDLNSIKSILKNRTIDIDQYDNFGRTALIYATIYQYTEIVYLLLKNGANPQLEDQDNKKTSLHYSSENGNLEITALLIKFQSTLSPQDDMKQTPLHSALNMGHLDIAKLLIKYGADINNRSKNGVTPLHYCAQFGFNELIKILLHKGAKIDAKDNKLQTPFHYACIHGQIVSAYVLMHEGSHITVCNLEEYNALQLAILNKQEKIVDFLLNLNYPVNNIAINNNNTLHCAVRTGNLNIVKSVVNNGSDLNALSFYGTALHESIENKDILKFLLDSGANPNIKGKHGYTPMHTLIRWVNDNNEESLFMLNSLINYGGDINIQSDNGCTPLHFALLFNKFNFANELLKRPNINLNIINHNGETISSLIEETNFLIK